MKFGSGFKEVDETTSGGNRMPAKGYVVKILNVHPEEKTFKEKKPMITWDVDISEGPHKGGFSGGKFPQRVCQVIADNDGVARAKGIMGLLIRENIGMFPEVGDKVPVMKLDGTPKLDENNVPVMDYDINKAFSDEGEIDEKSFINLTCGLITAYNKSGYVTPDYFVTKEKALAAPTLPEPDVSSPKKGDTTKQTSGQDKRDMF